jgi:phosphatidylcholine synthase
VSAGTAPGAAPGAARGSRLHAWAVHLYTSLGGVLAFFAAAEVCAAAPDPRRVFLLLAAAVVIDATDGTLARRWQVKRWLPAIEGRTIDDIVDYLTFTFVPLLLVWRMGWLPEPQALWLVPALVASLFGFANAGAKDETGGFFLGFPSYWNVVAFYAGLVHRFYGPWVNAVALLLLALLTVLPMRFLYPNLAPRPWRLPVLVGAVLWLGMMLWMLPGYATTPLWLAWLSFIYPAWYIGLSLRLGRARLRQDPH